MESRKTRHATDGRSGALLLLLLLLSGLRRKIRPRHHFPDSVTDIADGTTKTPPKDGSIIVVIATSAPLHPTQLRRLAKRATVGLARSVGWDNSSSGDVFLASSTAAELTDRKLSWTPTAGTWFGVWRTILLMCRLSCVADATEEAICNALRIGREYPRADGEGRRRRWIGSDEGVVREVVCGRVRNGPIRDGGRGLRGGGRAVVLIKLMCEVVFGSWIKSRRDQETSIMTFLEKYRFPRRPNPKLLEMSS